MELQKQLPLCYSVLYYIILYYIILYYIILYYIILYYIILYYIILYSGGICRRLVCEYIISLSLWNIQDTITETKKTSKIDGTHEE